MEKKKKLIEKEDKVLKKAVGGARSANADLPEYRNGKYYCPECGGEVEKSSMGPGQVSYYCPNCDWELEL